MAKVVVVVVEGTVVVVVVGLGGGGATLLGKTHLTKKSPPGAFPPGVPSPQIQK